MGDIIESLGKIQYYMYSVYLDLPGSLGCLRRCSAHRATSAHPQVADMRMTFS